MSIHYNANGTVLFTSDADPSVTQLQTAGQTQAAIDTAYAAFKATWPIAWLRAEKQADFDSYFDASFDIKAYIRAGTVTTVTGTQAGNFLAAITDNYRTLRASIASAANASTLNAINYTTGWPANP